MWDKKKDKMGCTPEDVEKDDARIISEENILSSYQKKEKKGCTVEDLEKDLEKNNSIQSSNLIPKDTQDLQPTKIFNPYGVVSSCTAPDSLTLDQKNIVINMCKNITFYNDNQSTNPNNLSVEKSFTENSTLERLNIKKGRLDDLENFTIQNYTTLQLIYDLIVEIQKFSEDLALIFPERLTTPIVKFNAYKLAKYWKACEKTTENRLYNINKNPNWLSIAINSKLFTDLENNLIEQFGIEKSKNCILIMEDYKNKKISGLEFNNRFLEELGRISGDIKLTPEEFSVICGFSEGFMWELKSKITNSKHRDYNPNYKFSIEALDQIKDLLNYYFGEKSKRCIDLIEKYKISNKEDMKEYRRQQHNVGKPHFFQEIKTTEQAYWLGFIAHDGWLITGTYDIGIELNVKDRAHLLKFAKVIDLDLDKNDIKDYIKRRIYNGELKESIHSLVQFGCKVMYQELQEISGIGSKADQKNVHQVVKNWITEAKSEAKELYIDWKYTDSGKKALAWLYGMYDADGTLREGNTGRIYSSIKSYLLEIKEFFDIRGEVLTQIEPGEELEVFGRSIIVKGMFKLHLSSDIYIPMVQSYMYGLSRKISYQPTSNEDDFLSY